MPEDILIALVLHAGDDEFLSNLWLYSSHIPSATNILLKFTVDLKFIIFMGRTLDRPLQISCCDTGIGQTDLLFYD